MLIFKLSIKNAKIITTIITTKNGNNKKLIDPTRNKFSNNKNND
jgi:hypothetical protein